MQRERPEEADGRLRTMHNQDPDLDISISRVGIISLGVLSRTMLV